MAELIVVGFRKDMFRVSEALNILTDMTSSWIVDLHDAVAVYRDDDGNPAVYGKTAEELLKESADSDPTSDLAAFRRALNRYTAKS